MQISIDLSAEVNDKLTVFIDKLREGRPTAPVWPFATATVVRLDLSLESRKVLDKYMAQFKVYEAWKAKAPSWQFSRSSVVERILRAMIKKGEI